MIEVAVYHLYCQNKDASKLFTIGVYGDPAEAIAAAEKYDDNDLTFSYEFLRSVVSATSPDGDGFSYYIRRHVIDVPRPERITLGLDEHIIVKTESGNLFVTNRGSQYQITAFWGDPYPVWENVNNIPVAFDRDLWVQL